MAHGGGETAKRVLVYRLGSLGDMLVALPALHLVRRSFPRADVRMLTNFPVNAKAPAAAAVLEHSGLVDGYFRYSAGTRSVRELARLWWQLVRWRPEILVYIGAPRGVESAKRDAAFFRLCGIRQQVGVPVTDAMQENLYGAPLLGGVPEQEIVLREGREPEAARLARNIVELGDARLDDPASWNLKLTEQEDAKAVEVIGADALALPMIAVSVGTKVQAKDWGADNWRLLLGRLAVSFPGHALLLAGAPEEAEASNIAGEGWRVVGGGPVINLCGKLTPRESAAAFSRARLFVGHDSGPMHLAASVQTPCVAIFAARNLPRVWFPFGRQHRVVYHAVECMGCGLETCIVERKKCLMSISVDEVMAEVEATLDNAEQAKI